MSVPRDDRSRRASRISTLLGLAVVMLVPACAPVHRTPEHPPKRSETTDGARDGTDDPGSALHVVTPGQTAWRIARAYGISLETLADANGLSDPTRIGVGDVLQIPGARAPIDVAPYPAPLDRPGSGVTLPSAVPLDAAELAWPVRRGRIVSGFGVRRGSRRHAGIDIDGERGDPVQAVAAGTVLYAGSSMRGYGKTVVLDHGGGMTTLYAHNSALDVVRGDRVERGDRIARIGRTGNATGTHLHFEIRLDDVPIDPLGLLGERIAESRR